MGRFYDIRLQKISWPWNKGQRSLKVIESGIIREIVCGFLLGVRPVCLCQICSGYFYSLKSYTGSQNFEIWPRDLGHAHLWVVLWSGRSRGPSCMSVPNLKRIALFFQKLLGGSQNFEFGSSGPSHAHFGVILWSRRSTGPSPISVPKLKQISPFVQKL